MHMIKTIMVAALAVSQVSFGANAANQGGGGYIYGEYC